MDQTLIVGIVLVVIAIIALAIYVEHQRTEKIKQIAESMGYVYRDSPRQHLPGSLWQLPLFHRGRSRRSRNLIQKEIDDGSIFVMEYAYTTGSGEDSHTYHQTVVVIHSSKLDLPKFELGPENFFHKVGRVLGFQDINFDSHPGFSKRYRLVGPNEGHIRSRFCKGVLSFFESQNQICAEGDRTVLILYHGGRKKSPESWPQLAAVGLRAYNQFC